MYPALSQQTEAYQKSTSESDIDSAQINGKTLSLYCLNERAFKKERGHSVSAMCHLSEVVRFLFSQITIKLEFK